MVSKQILAPRMTTEIVMSLIGGGPLCLGFTEELGGNDSVVRFLLKEATTHQRLIPVSLPDGAISWPASIPPEGWI